MNANFLDALSPNEKVLLFGQVLTFFGVVATAAVAWGNGARSERIAAETRKVQDGLHSIKVEINGRVQQLIEAVGGKREAEGFMKGKQAERDNPAISVANLISLGKGEKGERGERGERGANGNDHAV